MEAKTDATQDEETKRVSAFEVVTNSYGSVVHCFVGLPPQPLLIRPLPPSSNPSVRCR